MSRYTVRETRVRNPWFARPALSRGGSIAGAMIHCTRSGAAVADYDDGPGTERWAANANNGSAAQGWGGAWDRLVYRRDGTRVNFTDVEREYPTHCAGYGGDGTWAADAYYIQYELAQSRVDQPFTVAQIDSLAEAVAEDSRRYGFPLERIQYLAQTGTQPRGIATHEDSANGRRLGKSDPGPLFPWDDFLARARRYAGEEDDMALIDEVVQALGGIEAIRAWTTNPDNGQPSGNSLLVGYALEQEKLGALTARFNEHIDNHSAGVIGPVPDHTHAPGRVHRS